MAPAIYALLVGINEYQGSVPTLNGCVNDVARFKEFLELRSHAGVYLLDTRILTSGDRKNQAEARPTRQAVIDAFHEHLGQAKQGDIALFYYSGHGSQERAPMEFWHLEPDRLNETLVLYDSRTEGGWDLADKELAVLIAELARNNAHILIVLDACHSGSGTRAPAGTGIRLAPTDTRDRPLDTFLPGVIPMVKALSSAATAGSVADEKTGGWFSLPQGRHIVISACRPEQSAREKRMPDNEIHGVLSYYLLDTLQQAGPTLTYGDIFSRTSTLVRSLVQDQNPILASTHSDDLLQPFLGGAIVAQQPYAILEYQRRSGWTLKAGAIHGIERPSGDETTYLTVYPLEAMLLEGDLSQEIALAKVIQVGAAESLVEIEAGENTPLNTGEVYKAVVIATPLSAIDVYLGGDDRPALELLRSELEGSRLVRVSEDASRAAVCVTADSSNDSYVLARAGDRQPLNVPVQEKGTLAAAQVAAARVEHIARWLGVLNLENKHSQIPVDAVQLELFYYDRDRQASQPLDSAGPIRLTYDPKQGEDAVQFQLRIRHNRSSTRSLFCMLVDLSDDFAISTDASLFGAGIWLEPGDEAWATNENGEKYIEAYVPEDLIDMGVGQVSDVLKLIVSTDESDAALLRQAGLEVVLNQQTRGLEASEKLVPDTTLNRMMRRVQTRSIGQRPRTERLSDWRTSQVFITTVCQADSVAIPVEDGQVAELATGVTILAHPRLKASAHLENFQEGKRGLGNLALPAVFRDHPELSQPYDFQPSRGGDAGASVIVLKEVSNYQEVTPEAQLVIHSAGALAENEIILPVAYDPDSELFLPLGIGVQKENGVEIWIDRLPAPTADSRDVAGSIKLFIQKVVIDKVGAERLGLDGRTERLAAAQLDEFGRVVYDDSPIHLKAKVQSARCILLYIHGFTGDTRGMVSSAYGPIELQAPNTQPKLADMYDLILTFDYENINTPIEETASRLKKNLLEVGLGPNHGKTLHVVAHSLGCMVTRWFIERDNGNKFVQKAILVGPPNAGTPWAKIEEFLLVGLGAALNGLAAITWPPSAIPALIGTLAGLVGGVEKVDVTLDQLKPDSSFYRVLNASDDPGVEYIVIAGNTSKIAYMREDTLQAEQNPFTKLVNRLTSMETRNRILALAFMNNPNDIAISVKSMAGLPAARTPPPDFVEVACDHISYFNSEAGLEKVVQALVDR